MSTQIEILRDGLQLLPQVAAHNAAETPDLRSIFTPKSHEGALDPAREIVVGDRGVGKSFWSSVLKDDAARAAIAPIYPRLGLTDLTVSLGFSEVLARREYPSERTINSLLNSEASAEVIWRAVIVNSVNPILLPPKWEENDWLTRCKWIKENSQIEEEILSRFKFTTESGGETASNYIRRPGPTWKGLGIHPSVN